MQIIIILLKTFILSWFIVKFQPLKDLLTYIPIPQKNPALSIVISLLIHLLTEIISCLMCCSFWITLIFTGNIFIAALVAYLSFWYSHLMDKKETYLKFDDTTNDIPADGN